MQIRSIYFLLFGFAIAIAGCVFLFLSTEQTLSDPDYLYNYLHLSSEEDSTGIPIIGSMILALILAAVHSVFYFVLFIPLTRRKKIDTVKIRLLVYKDENLLAAIVRIICYVIAVFLLVDYLIYFFKFYLFEFVFTLLLSLTFISYGMNIALLNSKKTTDF